MLKIFLFFLLFLILILIFYPFKLKIKIIKSEEDLKIFLYKFEVLSLCKILKSHKNKNEDSKKEKKNRKKENTFKNKIFLFKSPKDINVKKLIKLLNLNRFKPTLNISLELTYSTEDAALTALLYGFLHQILSIVYLIFNSFFKFKNFHKDISPKFNDVNYLFFEIKGIITISFAQIIYIGFLYLLSLKKW